MVVGLRRSKSCSSWSLQKREEELTRSLAEETDFPVSDPASLGSAHRLFPGILHSVVVRNQGNTHLRPWPSTQDLPLPREGRAKPDTGQSTICRTTYVWKVDPLQGSEVGHVLPKALP